MKRTFLVSAATALALSCPGVALAQQAPAADAPAGLDDIVVTAQRKTESSQKAAIAIDVVSSADLAQAGVVNVATLSKSAPSLAVVTAGGPNTSFFIRGVGNFTFNGFTDPAVAFNIDGVYQGRATSTVGAFYDLERIEVLKGPQGTLYGRNATGGAINVLPNRPKLGVLEGFVAAGYGNYNAFDAEAAVNIPLGERGALRVSGRLVDSDGTNADGTNDENAQAFRVQMLTELTDTLTVRVAGDYAHQGGTGPGEPFDGSFAFRPGTPASATAPVNYVFNPANQPVRGGPLTPASRAYFAGRVIGGAFINPAPLDTPYNDNTYWGVNAEIALQTGAGTLTVIPAYREAKVNSLFNGPAFRGGLIKEDDSQFSLEARFQANRIGAFDLLAGAYYYNETVKGDYTFNQYVVNAFADFTSKTKSYALFGRVTANLSDQFRLVGGARYTKDDKSFVADAPTLLTLCANAPPPFGPGCFGGPSLPTVSSFAEYAALGLNVPSRPGPPVPFGTRGNILVYAPLVINQTQGFDKVTYRAAIEYDIAPRSLLYASFETGYRSGGFSASLGHEQVRPEYVDAWTIGSKNRFFDNKVQLNIEAFWWKYRDQQITHFGPDANGNSSFFSENIGRATIKGVDVEGQVLVTPTTLLRGTVQYLDSKVTSFTYDVVVGATPPIVGCPYTAAVNTAGRNVYRVNCAGQAGYNAPKWSANLGIEQTIAVGNYQVVFNGDMRYRSNRVIGFDYLPQQNSGADTVFDASLRFGPADERWSLIGYVRNLTNQDVKVLTQFSSSTGNVVTTQYMPPRTYGVRASFKF